MAHRSDIFKAYFLLWCILGSALGVPTTTSSTHSYDDQRLTTRRRSKVIIDLPTMRTRLPFPVENSEVRTTTTVATTTTTLATTSSATSTTTTVHAVSNPKNPLYRLDGSNGQACILLQVDALITVKYRTKLGEQREANIYVPGDATVTGNCDNDNVMRMSLKWDAFVLTWTFAKTPGNERWFVEKIELTYNSSDRHFEHIDQPNKTIRLSTDRKHSSMLFPTPVGKSYVCTDEMSIPLTDGRTEASVLLRELKLQPFKFKNNEFAEEFSCATLNARAGRDETAPVAVGSILAAATLLTITGYAAYRYFKVKKVKYDTME